MTENRPEVARPLAGIALMVLAMQLVAVTDAAAKILSADYSVLQISWARCFFQFIFLLPIFLVRHKPRIAAVKIQPRAILRHSIRGGLFAAAMSSFFVAIRDNPIPDSLAVLFISPLFVTAAAPFLLRESFDWRRGGGGRLGIPWCSCRVKAGRRFSPDDSFRINGRHLLRRIHYGDARISPSFAAFAHGVLRDDGGGDSNDSVCYFELDAARFAGMADNVGDGIVGRVWSLFYCEVVRVRQRIFNRAF